MRRGGREGKDKTDPALHPLSPSPHARHQTPTLAVRLKATPLRGPGDAGLILKPAARPSNLLALLQRRGGKRLRARLRPGRVHKGRGAHGLERPRAAEWGRRAPAGLRAFFLFVRLEEDGTGQRDGCAGFARTVVDGAGCDGGGGFGVLA